MDSTTLPPFMTMAEAADYCRVSIDTIKRHMREGRLTRRRFGRRVLVSTDELTGLIRAETAA